MQVDNHAFDRMKLRLTETERTQIINTIFQRWNRLENKEMRDIGIVAMPLSKFRKTDDSGWESNGDTVVGIVRKGILKTIMLRRLNQPMTNDALRVDAVRWAFKPPHKSKRKNNRRYR
jgi:hypothetical protein